MADYKKSLYNIALGQQGYLLQGTPKSPARSMVQAPVFGNRFSMGDRDYNDFTFWWYWAQKDWSGGMKNKKSWEDDAKFYFSTNIDAFKEYGTFRLVRPYALQETLDENMICGAEGRIDPPVRPTGDCLPTTYNIHWVGGSTDWTDPTNAHICNETFATAADGTDYTWWKAFKVSTWAHLWRTDPESPYTSELGSDDIITGVEVIIKGKATGTTPNLSVSLAKNCVSGPEIGSKNIPLTTTNTEHTLGGRYDLWGTTWSPADFDTAGNFGVGLHPGAVGTGYTYSVDCIKVKVYFTKASTGKTYYIGTDKDASGKPVIYQCDKTATIDSYSESNHSALLSLYSGDNISYGQSFTNPDTITLDSCKFYINKVGLPTGNVTVKVYAHSGTYGTSSIPTGSALATSDVVDISTLTTSKQLITFHFSGANKIALSASTYYVVTITYSGGDVSNLLQVSVDSTSPTHSGNKSYSTDESGWTAQSTQDLILYVYGVDEANGTNWSNITDAYMSTGRTLISQILFHRGILWFLTEGTDQNKLVTSWDGHTFTDHTADIRTDIERPGLFNSATCAAGSDEESSEPYHFVIALLDEDKEVITIVDAVYDADDLGDLPNSWERWRTIENLGEIRMADMVFFGDQWVIGLLSKPPDVWLGFLSSTSPFVAKLAFKDATIEEKGLGGKLLVHLPVLRDLIITIPENEIYRFDTVKGIRLLNREDTRKEIIEANTENDFWIKKGGVLAHDKIVWGHLVGEAVTVGSGWDSITQMNFQGGIREHLFPLFADDLHKVWAVDIATRKKLYKESDDYVATTADENFLIFSEFDTIATVDKLVYSVNIVFKPLEEDQKIVLWYSLDGGLTWESLGEVSEAVDGGEIITKTFLFPENTIVKKVMLKVGIEDTSGTSTPVFEDISMAYYPVPDYKQRWEIRVQCFDDLVLLDGKTQEAKRGEELRNILNGYWRNREIVEFQDVDFAETELSANITVDQNTIPVLSAASFPEKGIIRIGAEKIKYDGKSGVAFLSCVRGYGGTIAKEHTEADVCSNSYKTIITNYSERTPVGAETKINEFLVDLQLIEI